MKSTAIAAFVVLTTLAPISFSALAQVSAPPGAPIANVCDNVAGQSATQRETCVRQEEKSGLNFDPAKADPAVRKFCQGSVGEEAALQNACIQQESLSKARTETMKVDAPVRQRCEKQAGDSFVKLEACLEEQSTTP